MMDLLDDYGLLNSAHHWLTHYGAQSLHYTYEEGRFTRSHPETSIFNEQGLACTAGPRAVLIMVAFALGFDDKKTQKLFKNHAFQYDDIKDVTFHQPEIVLYGKSMSKIDLGIFVITTLGALSTNWRFTKTVEKIGDPIVELGLLHVPVKRYWLGTRLESPLHGDHSEQYGKHVASAITRVEHLPQGSFETLFQRMGAFSDLVVKHKVEPIGQWECMLIDWFDGPATQELREAFLDVANGEHRQPFLLGLSSLMSDRSGASEWLRKAIFMTCEMAGQNSAITQALTSCVVRANTENERRTVEFGQSLIRELLDYEAKDIGYAQLKALEMIPSETYAADVELSSQLVVKLVSAFQLMIDGVLAGHKKEDRHDHLTENVLAILGGDKADVVFVEAIQTIITTIKPVPVILDSLGQKEQDTLVLLGYEMKGLTKTSRRLKGQILMNELGL
jgi:hypothetical protein